MKEGLGMKKRLPISGLCELVLEVTDMAEAVDFWHGKLGLPVVEQWVGDDAEPSEAQEQADEPWATWFYVGGNTRLGLWLKRDFTSEEESNRQEDVTEWDTLYDEGGAHVHCAFFVPMESFDQALEVLEASNIPTKLRTWDEDETVNGKERSAYFKDPSKNVIELYTKNMDEAYEKFGGEPVKITTKQL